MKLKPEDGNDEIRVAWVFDYYKRPWKIVQGKRSNRDAWVLESADGQKVQMSGRAFLATVVKAVNGMQA